jgi:hypothetical protein
MGDHLWGHGPEQPPERLPTLIHQLNASFADHIQIGRSSCPSCPSRPLVVTLNPKLSLSFIDGGGNSDGVEAVTVKELSIFESKPASAASFRPGRPFPFTVYSAACDEMLSDDCARL